jgi:inosine-uridine nucleoside N-ribohydrolase
MTKVWLDCDPGHDDALAILLAQGSSSIDLVGISAVSGNQSLEKTYRNAQIVRRLAGITEENDIPVLSGMDRPLIRKIRHDPGIHGDSGLDGSSGLDAYAKTLALETFDGDIAGGLNAMMKGIEAAADPTVTLVATGALTNVAMLLRLYPKQMKRCVKEIVLMGGAIGIGNRSSVAEFNILCDPEAARIVFEADFNVVMVPLEVTHTAIATASILDTVRGSGTPFGQIVHDLLVFFKETYETVFDFKEGPPVHDACAIAYVIDPTLFTAKKMRVDVMCDDGLTMGQTVCDVWGYEQSKPPNVVVCQAMNVPGFWELTLDAIDRCNKASPVNK